MPRGSRSQHDQPVSLFSFQDIVASITGIMLLVTLLLAMELMNRTEGAPPVDETDVTESVTALKAERERVAALRKSVAALRQRAAAMQAGQTITQQELDEIQQRILAIQKSIDRLNGVIGKFRGEADQLKGKVTNAKMDVDTIEAAIAAAEKKRDEQSKKSLVRLLGGKATGKKPYLVECSDDEIAVGDTDQLRGGAVKLVKRFSGDRRVREFLRWAGDLEKGGVQFVLLVRSGGIDTFSPVAGTLRHHRYTVGWDVWPAGKSLFPRPGGGG